LTRSGVDHNTSSSFVRNGVYKQILAIPGRTLR
jgi:hypothetical protein